MKRKLRGLKRTDIQLDFDLYRVSVPMPGVAGDELSVIDIWPEGVERTIVFVHGYAGCAETWEHQINYFSKEYRVVVPDLRGHGQSDAPYTRYTMQEMVADLNAVAWHLRLPPQFVLVGHSFGGSICVEYASAYADRLERLVLIATAGEYPLSKAVTLTSRLPTALVRPLWEYRPAWNAEVHVLKRMAVNNMMQWQGWTLMRHIQTPTLVITGERDNYFPRYVFEDVGRIIPGAQVVDVGASKHKVQLERHQAVNRAIDRFIEQDQRRTSWREDSAPLPRLARRPWLKAYPHDIPVTVPIPRQPLHTFLESAADWRPKQTATLFFGARLSYDQLNRQANQFAHVLHGLGLRPGDRVMIALPNMPELVVAFFGTLKTGAVAVFPTPDSSPAIIAEQARQSDAKVLVTLSDFEPLVAMARSQGGVSEVILVDLRAATPVGLLDTILARWSMTLAKTVGSSAFTEGHTRRMQALMWDAPEVFPRHEVPYDAEAAILFTSGATGAAKGVRLTHANLVANAVQMRHWIPRVQYGQEIFLSVTPLLHSYGLTVAMNLPIALGATMLLLPTFDLGQVLHHIHLYRPTIFPGVPSMFSAINQAPNVRSYGLSAVKVCISGAGPLPVEVREMFEKLTQGQLIESYGLTEATALTHVELLDTARTSGSMGVPLPNTDAKIVDLTTGQDLPIGQIGHLVIKGPQVMAGYLDATKTAEALRDGWLTTGDLAIMNEEGYFRLIGRGADTITVNGHKVYPRDVEEVLYEHSKIYEAAVTGIADPLMGQAVCAFVVPRSGAVLTEAEVLEHCRRRLEEHAVPRRVEFRQELPRSSLGRVLVHRLVESLAAAPPMV